MKTKNLTGQGVVGNKIVVNVVDMVMLSMLADRLEKVTDNHKAIADYNALPYDKRTDELGNKIECPKKIEAADADLKDIAVFLRKCAGSFAKSQCFNADDCCEIVECSSDEPEHHL